MEQRQALHTARSSALSLAWHGCARSLWRRCVAQAVAAGRTGRRPLGALADHEGQLAGGAQSFGSDDLDDDVADASWPQSEDGVLATFVLQPWWPDPQLGAEARGGTRHELRREAAAGRPAEWLVRRVRTTLGRATHYGRQRCELAVAGPEGAASVASFLAAFLTEIYLCNFCSCQEILRRNGRG
eukprot:COSAG01_NODE_601_length_14954_cov_175.954359_8_plen_185_part_00